MHLNLKLILAKYNIRLTEAFGKFPENGLKHSTTTLNHTSFLRDMQKDSNVIEMQVFDNIIWSNWIEYLDTLFMYK